MTDDDYGTPTNLPPLDLDNNEGYFVVTLRDVEDLRHRFLKAYSHSNQLQVISIGAVTDDGMWEIHFRVMS